MKYLSLFFCLIFILFAGLQYNDPDPILWMPIYGIAAYCAFRAYQGKSNREMLLILFILATAAGINSWGQMTAWEGFNTENMAMKSPNQEIAREAVGLFICSASFVYFYFINSIKTK